MNKNTIALLLAFPLFISCQRDDENLGQLIIGSWYQESEYSETKLTYRTELIFRTDNTYESSVMIVDKSDNSTLGFLSLIKGNYKVVENKLYQSHIFRYGLNNSSPYADKNKLELLYKSGDEGSESTVSFSSAGNQMVVDYGHCSDILSACIQQQTYYRLN